MAVKDKAKFTQSNCVSTKASLFNINNDLNMFSLKQKEKPKSNM